MKKIAFLPLALILGLGSSCSLYQKPKIPALEIPYQFKYEVQAYNPKLNHYWWKNFNDPHLNALVCTALQKNYDYLIALKNIEIAKMTVAENYSNYFPVATVTGSGTRNQISGNGPIAVGSDIISSDASGSSTAVIGTNKPSHPIRFNLFQIFSTVTYELDVWNQIGNSVNQACAILKETEAAGRVVKLTLISNVAEAYFQISAANTNLFNLKQQLQAAQEILHLEQTQYRSGLIDQAPVDDARNQIEAIRINIAQLTQQKSSYENSLAYLLGNYPECLQTQIYYPLRKLNFGALIPPEIPCKMLANRPDVQQSLYQIFNYGYLEKQNIANFLPSFNLIGQYGFSSLRMSNLFSPNSLFWDYGTNIIQTIFDFEKRLAIYKASKLEYEAAILNYQKTAVNAFKEVNDALLAYRQDLSALSSYQQQVHNLYEKLHLAEAQFKAGLIDYQTYLPYRLQLLQTSYALNNQRLSLASDVIQIYKTLGLGL